ncbi:MAG: nucleotide sugar dehydrogenase, partial [Culicoidibacterales bacterium]
MKIAIIGLGYVGISLASTFAEKHEIIGFDVNQQKVAEYKKGIDRTDEVGATVNQLGIQFTTEIGDIQGAEIILVTVPTPTIEGAIDATYVKKASEMIAPYMSQGTIVVYESTVYPFFTREECLPLLEKYSGKTCGVDFSVGYSPERVNPGDKVNTIETIVKVVAGIDAKTTQRLVDFYGSVIHKVHAASSLEVAEACKVLENSQRDVNIALINQFAMLFEDIDTHAVVEAMNTKWNALGFTSGLVGGHCIAEDPHYLIHKTRSRGMKFTMLEEARYVNDQVPKHIVTKAMELLNESNKALSNSTIVIKGITFKENCPDVRNSKAVEIYQNLKKHG